MNLQSGQIGSAIYIEAPEVFLFPGLGGDELELAALRLGCAPTLQCIPVRFPYWTDHARTLTLDQLVDHCCVQIESLAPTGDLRLAGYSFGGTIAYAVAKALTAAGRRVEWLGLVDAPSGLHVSAISRSPHARRRRWANAVRERQFSQEIARTIVGAVMRLRKPRLLIALGRLCRFQLPFDMHKHVNGHVTCRLREHLLRDLIERMHAHQARLDVPAVMFRPTQQIEIDAAPDLGWGRHLSSLQIVNLPGDHHTVIKPENIAMLCSAFICAMAARPRPPHEVTW